MSWIDRLLGKPKTPSTEDPVGPIGGSMRPVSPHDTAPFISPGNPGGTWAPMSKGNPSIDSQQTGTNAIRFPSSPDEGNFNQVTRWPTEVHSEVRLPIAPVKGKGDDPNWHPENFNRVDPVPGHISYSFNRPWHLAPRLDGNRTFFEASDIPVPSSEGYSGLRSSPRASMFVEPAPWSTNVIDTTRASGTPTSPGNAQTPTSVVYSTSEFVGSNNRSHRLR